MEIKQFERVNNEYAKSYLSMFAFMSYRLQRRLLFAFIIALPVSLVWVYSKINVSPLVFLIPWFLGIFVYHLLSVYVYYKNSSKVKPSLEEEFDCEVLTGQQLIMKEYIDLVEPLTKPKLNPNKLYLGFLFTIPKNSYYSKEMFEFLKSGAYLALDISSRKSLKGYYAYEIKRVSENIILKDMPHSFKTTYGEERKEFEVTESFLGSNLYQTIKEKFNA